LGGNTFENGINGYEIRPNWDNDHGESESKQLKDDIPDQEASVTIRHANG
jgi:hypothetical protein